MNDNYTWFYDKNDKIGISTDGSKMIHDSIIFTLKKFRKITSEKNQLQLIYELSGWNDPTSSVNKKYFSDLTLHEKGNYLSFKYVEDSKGNMKFVYAIFNGRNFK